LHFKASYKFLEEANPYLATPSRNVYFLAAATGPDYLPRDSNNSTGTLYSHVVGPVTLYIKIIVCSLTVNASTTIIDGLNRPANRSDELLEPTAHPWAIQQPLPSRSFIYEDTFSALFGTPTGLVVHTSGTNSTVDNPIPLTLLEVMMIDYGDLAYANLYGPPVQHLQWLEFNLMRITSISYACLGEYFGYQNLDLCVRHPLCI
jgi:hypothetical protein